jgi:cob(I)alamin adenosyltransferase
MGEAWSPIRKTGTEAGRAAGARECRAQVKRDLDEQAYRFCVLDEFAYPVKWGWADTDDAAATLAARPGTQHAVITRRNAGPRLVGAAGLVVSATKVKHLMDAGQKCQAGIEW